MTLQRIHTRAQAGHDGNQVPQQADRPYLTVAQLVTYLQLGSGSAVYRLIREHGLPYGRIGGRYRFNPRHVDRWVESCGGAVDALRKRVG